MSDITKCTGQGCDLKKCVTGSLHHLATVRRGVNFGYI